MTAVAATAFATGAVLQAGILTAAGVSASVIDIALVVGDLIIVDANVSEPNYPVRSLLDSLARHSFIAFIAVQVVLPNLLIVPVVWISGRAWPQKLIASIV